MNLTITESAVKFYKQEMKLLDNDAVRFFVRVGGVGSGGFSAGITKDLPVSDRHSVTVNHITFYVSSDDEWYFDGMTIDFNEDRGEVQFSNPKIEDVTNPQGKG
ncbi:iron-sulfur cluster biosynthesis family protein [Alteribacter populi]|uniref:iron-sulfur cluster biosynthesis family protein n=1 Tax=Alteribacter populi TaxID=2011011 RepID=UPI000BBB4A98|nr:iron-sulfur cluster biosynthesis family protein [Alteribacter populi]